MLPLQAHGYRSGFSASPGFRQIRHTSSSSSSSSSYLGGTAAVPVAEEVDSISFPLEPRGDEAEEEEEEEEGEDDDGELASVSTGMGPPSREGGGSWAISMTVWTETAGDRVGGKSGRVREKVGEGEKMKGEKKGRERREKMESDWRFCRGDLGFSRDCPRSVVIVYYANV